MTLANIEHTNITLTIFTEVAEHKMNEATKESEKKNSDPKVLVKCQPSSK